MIVATGLAELLAKPNAHAVLEHRTPRHMEGATEQQLLMWMDVVRTAASPGPRLGRRLFSATRVNAQTKCCSHLCNRFSFLFGARKLNVDLLGLDLRFIDVSDDFQTVKLGDGQVDAERFRSSVPDVHDWLRLQVRLDRLDLPSAKMSRELNWHCSLAVPVSMRMWMDATRSDSPRIRKEKPRRHEAHQSVQALLKFAAT